MRIIHYSVLALVASGLVACGGSSGDSDDNGTGGSNQNQAPVAANLSVEYDWAEDFEPIDVLSIASASSGGSLTLQSVGDADYGSTAIEGNLVSYTPSDDFIGIDSFTYVISDGSLESEGTVEVEVVSTVAMEGRVVDSPIANATVSITIDGVVHQAEADDEGFYTLPLTIRSVESEEVIRITARGSEANGQEHVTLSSILVSAGRLLGQANDGGKITRREMNDVNVTHVTTARDVLTRRAAGDEAITQANISEFGNTIDPQLLIQMAAVTKLIIDDANFNLPAGYDSIEDFLNNNESYNEFVETASAGGESSPLNQAIAETLDDPEIVPELRAEDLYGRYIQIERAPSFLKPAAYTTWSITQDGVAWYDVPAHFGERATFSLNGNRMVMDTPNVVLRQMERFDTVTDATFEGRPEVAEAWLASGGSMYSQYRREITAGMTGARVVSQGDNELIIRYNSVTEVRGYTFEHEGNVYEVWPDEITESEIDTRLVKADVFLNSDLTFNFTNESTWLLPGIIPPAHISAPTLMLYELASDNTWRMPQAALYLHDAHYAIGSTYSEADLNGTWELSADNRHLTLTSASGDSVRFTRHRYDAEQKTVLAEYLFDGEPLITKLLHGMPLPQELDFSAIEQVRGSNLLFNSILSYNHAIFWDENDRARVQSFMFDFAEDGTGEQVQGLCKGEMFWDSEICPEPMKVSANTVAMTWEFNDNNLFGELFAFDRNASGHSNINSMRYWVPLEFSGPDIFSVLEWNTWSYSDEGSVDMILEPRFNQYQLTERPETYQAGSAVNFGAMNEVSGAFNHGYKVVNPQVDSVVKPLH